METNPYEYTTTGQWIPQPKQYNAAGQPVGPQNRPYRNGYNNVQASQVQAPPPRKAQAPAPQKMPKARAQALVYRFKQWIIAISLVSFGTFSALIAFHQIDSATATTTSTSSGTSLATPTATSTSQSGSNFLQQGGNNVGSGSSSSSTATSTPTATPTPVSGTHTS